ncbi:unnamed protein product [Zymoseptoria tritici ST99CH_1A5]|uniref:Uncharacterized protein n=1 Tax=Zymoseptoria tritici ST99CH_1A5 TaxID=1276529 RepID=A0A1Y6LRQ1_ZYMTR|nr:unnamed protein product [Zymoseptoria tritici ST99CH_3D1]SMY27067.1 unnamed protein product [Zymoseptoria tritici ST99CH_1A5]
MSSSDEEDNKSWNPATETHPSIDLPLAFKIYCAKSRLTHSEFYIAHEKNKRLHAISGGYKGWLKSTVGLHQGPSIDTPTLANAIIKHKTIEVTLPTGTTYSMQDCSSFKAHLHSASEFDFEFPIPGIPAPEHFEWRRSQGPEVASLDGRGKGGWVLLRVAHGADGEGEVVAAYSVDLTSIKLSGNFAFFNSGRTSEMGADWVVMIVVTALALGQKKRDAMSGMVAISSV